MKKICIITNIPSPYRVDLFNYLIENFKEYNFEIIYSSVSEDDRGWNLDSNKLKNSHFLKSRSIVIKEKLDNKHIHFSFEIKKCLKKYNPDVIIGCEYNPISIVAYTWAKLNNKKYISWSDGTLNSEKNINILQKIIRKIICGNSNALIASSSKTKEAQIAYGADKNNIYLSYLTVDIHKYLTKKCEKKYEENLGKLLFVGRLSYTKGVDLLLNALSKIDCKYLLTIVGDGEERKKLEKLSCDLGIKDKVNFVGFKSNNELKSIYNENNIFILPSRCDCFGLVILEAMCNSMQIISSKYADGAYDLIKDGENGYIVDIYNEEELINILKNSLKNPKLVKEMGEKSQSLVYKFDFKNVSSEIIKAIRRVVIDE